MSPDPDCQTGARKFLLQIVDRDLVTVRQPAETLEPRNIETDCAAENWRHGLDAMPFPAAVVARLRGQMSAIDAPILLDVDEGIDVCADVQRPEHRLYRILERRESPGAFRRVGEGHGEAHEFWIVRDARIELEPEIVDTACPWQSQRAPHSGVIDPRKRADRFRSRWLLFTADHFRSPAEGLRKQRSAYTKVWWSSQCSSSRGHRMQLPRTQA